MENETNENLIKIELTQYNWEVILKLSMMAVDLIKVSALNCHTEKEIETQKRVYQDALGGLEGFVLELSKATDFTSDVLKERAESLEADRKA